MSGVRSNRKAPRQPQGAHPFLVTNLVVYPTARRYERRVVTVQLELREMHAGDRRVAHDAVALFKFLRREA
jgi:hypothetical protein